MKFGGTSVEDSETFRNVAQIVNSASPERIVVVVSAIGGFTDALLSSVEQAVIVVDSELRITKWSRAASELWGLREEEVEDQHLLNLDIGVRVGELREPIRRVLAGSEQEPVRLEGHNRRGQAVRCEVGFTQLRSHLDELQGVILVMTAEKAEV